MKRLIGILFALVAAFALPAQAEEVFLEGAHYERIDPPLPTSAPAGQVEVMELFWYGCPHCYSLEPHLVKWLETKPASVSFRRVPAVMNPNWTTHAQAYFAAEKIGAVETIHGPMFYAIHAQGRRLNSLDQIARFFATLGVDEQKFRAAFNDPAIRGELQQAFDLGRASQANGVPALIVNGKYRTSASMAGGYPEMLDVVNYLVKLEAAAQ